MYNILIVDDEPLICQGLTNLLTSSGIHIQQIYTALSGYEALDYLRLESIDLLITDIQMGSMNGIELMQQAKIIKPWVQVIVISAHETFQYAQQAMRLGAKDYLIKPLNSEQLLSSVRHLLLHMDKKEQVQDEIIAQLVNNESFRMKASQPDRDKLLVRLIQEENHVLRKSMVNELVSVYETTLCGPYFAIIKLLLRPNNDRQRTMQDKRLLHYGALNIAAELLDQQWAHCLFEDEEGRITIIMEWSEEKYGDSGVNQLNQLEMIGRSLHHNIEKYLGLVSVVGISQIFRGIEFLNEAHMQTEKALNWSRSFQDHYVFYFGDFRWSIVKDNEPNEAELAEQNNFIVARCREYIDQNYAQKGLTLNEIAQKNHVSPNYLSYLFKKISGYNLWEYVVKLRMEESKRLLIQTDMRRYEIAERVGYESPEHFSKIFKKYFGVSPSEMKK